ncbi:MAG: response regulator, partial [Pseudomonadales bacterium]|nr:response regulator [Pseudomonadales bacterium]
MTHLKILVCHNSRAVNAFITDHLGNDKVFNIQTCSDVFHSLRTAFDFKPDLMIIGTEFEDGDAKQLIKQLKSAEVTHNTPILVFADDASQTFKRECYDAGAEGIFSHPFNHDEFIKTVNLVIGSNTSSDFTSFKVNQNMRILVVEDSQSYQNMYKDLITKLGYEASYFENGKLAWDALSKGLEVDLIITDIIMPVMDGKEFATLIRSDYQYNNVPLVVASSIGQFVTLKDFFQIGVNDYFTKPLDEEIFSCRVIAHLRTRQLLKQEASLKRKLSTYNERLTKEVKSKTAELVGAKNEVINKLAKVAEYKDDVTGSHIYRVRAYTEELARTIGLNDEKVEAIGLGSMMHDIGKIAIPDSILKKQGKLTPEERKIMDTHPVYGERLFSDSRYFVEAKNIAGGHHEKWDGSGYP